MRLRGVLLPGWFPRQAAPVRARRLDEFCKEVDAPAPWKRHRCIKTVGGGVVEITAVSSQRAIVLMMSSKADLSSSDEVRGGVHETPHFQWLGLRPSCQLNCAYLFYCGRRHADKTAPDPLPLDDERIAIAPRE
jgi:hypothetical protein